MKNLIVITLMLCTSFCKINAQDFQGDAHIDILIDRPFTETFRVRQAEISSGNLEINEALFALEGNMQTAGTMKGFGADNKFSNFGGKGLFTIFQASPFKGMVGKFFFEENVNGTWQDAAILYVDMPLIGSKEIRIDYMPGFGARGDFNKQVTSSGWSHLAIESKGNGYLLSDMLGNSDWKSRGLYFKLWVSLEKREWLNQSENLPVSGSTTIYGTINIDKQTIVPNDGFTFEEAIKKTLKLNLMSPTKAVWIKQDNDDSYVQLQNERGVGNVEVYDFDNVNFTAKYQIKNAPNIVYCQKYFDNQNDLAQSLIYDYIDGKPRYNNLYSEVVGKFLYFDVSNKEKGKSPIYNRLSFEVFGDAEKYWKPANGNQMPNKNSLIVDPNNIFNSSPQLKITAAANQGTPIISTLQNTTYDQQGNINIEATSFTIQGLWSVSNQKNGLIIDPNYKGWQSKINAVINPGDINARIATNSIAIQSANQKNTTLIKRTNIVETKLNINSTTNRRRISDRSAIKTKQ